jgi:hypothetical protein
MSSRGALFATKRPVGFKGLLRCKALAKTISKKPEFFLTFAAQWHNVDEPQPKR